MNSQIPLSFPVNESRTADDFMVLPCNEVAVEWIDRYPSQWSYPALIIYGEQGCGKTHFLNLLRGKVESSDIVIDDVDAVFGDDDAETDLFHRFNQAKENGRFMVLTMSKHIAQQNIQLPDLASRLRAAPCIEIESPDEISLQAILVKLFHDRQLAVEPGVINYILPRIERSFASAHDLVRRIDESSLSEKRSVTVPLVRNVLGGEGH
jgi:chromosomal replication initiation ATPase DnaA